MFSLWYGGREGNHRENLLSYKGNWERGLLVELVGWLPSSNTGSSHHCRQKGRLAVVLLHLQAGILGKAVGSAITPHIFCAGAVQHSGWRGPFWPLLLGLLAKIK